MLASAIGLAFLFGFFGFVLGKYSSHRWGVKPEKHEPLKQRTTTYPDGHAFTVLFRESTREGAVRMERDFARMFVSAKNRGLIR